MSFKRFCSNAVVLSILSTSIVSAQAPPRPVFVPAPPPVRVIVAPPPVVVPAPVPYRPYRRHSVAGSLLQVFGGLLIAFGLLAIIGGGVVLLVGAGATAQDPC